AAALLLFADSLLTSASAGTGVNPLLTLELKTYDWRLAHTARPENARSDIALIEIDERSLRTLQPFAGRWPWPRVVHSSLIDYLARAHAKLIVYDVLFIDPDKTVGFQYGGDSWSGRQSDDALADSVKKAGNVIVPADASFDSENPPIPETGYRL